MVVSELLRAGYKKIDLKSTTGQTALHIACSKGYKEITEMLIEHQANVEARDEEGVTPLHVSLPSVVITRAVLSLSYLHTGGMKRCLSGYKGGEAGNIMNPLFSQTFVCICIPFFFLFIHFS